jgi:hypothetical protein
VGGAEPRVPDRGRGVSWPPDRPLLPPASRALLLVLLLSSAAGGVVCCVCRRQRKRRERPTASAAEESTGFERPSAITFRREESTVAHQVAAPAASSSPPDSKEPAAAPHGYSVRPGPTQTPQLVERPRTPPEGFESTVAHVRRSEASRATAGRLPAGFQWRWPREDFGAPHLNDLLRVLRPEEPAAVEDFLRRFPLDDPAAYAAFRKRLDVLHDWYTSYVSPDLGRQAAHFFHSLQHPDPEYYLSRYYRLMKAIDEARDRLRNEQH